MSVVELLEQCIDKKLRLKRVGKNWKLTENNITIEFKAPNNNSFGFSLDTEPSKFGFFSGTPPKHIAKMCDGIIACNYKQRDYIVLIEQKNKNKGRYKKQIINGYYFCEWLLGLLKEHEHYNDKVVYLGLLYRRRRSPIKGSSTHKKKAQAQPQHKGVNFFKTNDCPTYLKRFMLGVIKPGL